MKKSLTLLALCALVAGCQHNKAAGTAQVDLAAPPVVSVVRPENSLVTRTADITGEVHAFQEAKLYAKVSGYLKTIDVDKGDHVEAGQLLATLDSPELAREVARSHDAYNAALASASSASAQASKATAEVEGMDAEYQRAMSQVEEAQASVKRAEGDVKLTHATWRRMKQVYDKDNGLIARQDLDIAEARKDDAELKLLAAKKSVQASRQNVKVQASKRSAAQSQVHAYQAQVEQSMSVSRASIDAENQARDLLSYTEIRAPFSGLITQRNFDPGALIQNSASSSTARPVLVLDNYDRVRIYAHVPESDVSFVKMGTRVVVMADELPNDKFTGTVGRIAGAIDPDSRTMLVETDLNNPGHLLRPGMSVKVRFELESRPHAITIPPAALVMDGERRFVYVVTDGKTHKKPVVTGYQQPDRVEIKQGLKLGEQVVVAGKENISEGTTVRLSSPAAVESSAPPEPRLPSSAPAVSSVAPKTRLSSPAPAGSSAPAEPMH